MAPWMMQTNMSSFFSFAHAVVWIWVIPVAKTVCSGLWS
jgi:hypothetical protein